MLIELSLETTPTIIKKDYKILIEYQGKELQLINNKYIVFIHTIHERIFEKIIIKFNKKLWRIIGTSFFGEIRINKLQNGINYISIYPGLFYGKYLNYNHINKQIGISTILCKIKGRENAELQVIYTHKNIFDKIFSSLNIEKRKKFLFFLYQTKQIFEGTNFCNLNVLKGIYLLEKLFYNEEYLNSSRYKRNNYVELNINFIKKYKNLLYYAIAPYGKFITLRIPKRTIITITGISEKRKRILEFLNIPNEDLIGVYITEFKPAHIIFKVKNTLYVSFRGTETLNDVSNDIYTKYSTFKNGYIHEGIKDLSDEFYNYYHNTLLEIYNKHNCNKIIFLGHSLGGSLAIMCGILFKSLINNLNVYAFSPAPFITEEVIKELNCNDYIISIINGDDIFPRLSLGSLLDLKYICSSIGSNINLHKRNNFKEFLNYYKKIKIYLNSEKKYMKFYLPGKLFHIKKFPQIGTYLMGSSILKRFNLIDYSCVVLIKEVQFDFFNEIIISAGFYSDHILQTFLNVFLIAEDNIQKSSIPF